MQAVLNLIITAITARYLGPTNYGVISYVTSIISFLTPVTYLGLEKILVQETIRNPEQEGMVFGTSLVMSFLSSLACYLCAMLFVFTVNAGERETILVCVLYGLVLLCQAVELIQYWFQAKLLSKYYSVISLCAYGVVFVYRAFLLVTGKSVYWFAAANTIDHFLICVALLFTYRRLGGAKLRFSADMARGMFRRSRYYIISGVMVTVFAQTDKIMLKLMVDTAATGYYTAALTAAVMTSFVFSAIIDSMCPAILQAQEESEEQFRKNMCRLYAVIIYLSIAQSVVMSVCAKLIINILYGETYAPAVGVLRLIVWYTTFSYLGPVRNIWILAKGKQQYLWIINLSGAVLNVILNALLIPGWGIYGAAFASLVTQIFTNFILGFLLKPIRENNRLILEALNGKALLRDIRQIF